MRKKKLPKKRWTLFKKGNAKNSYLVIIGVVLALAGMLAGGLDRPPVSRIKDDTAIANAFSCCDTGDGESCRARTDKTITFRGSQYGLLKSNFKAIERSGHLAPRTGVDQDGKTVTVFINNRDDEDPDGKPGCSKDDDWIPDRKPDGSIKCFPIPDEQLIYVCRDDNAPGICANDVGEGYLDAYWRMDGYPIPEPIKNCVKPTGSMAEGSGVQTIVLPTYPDPGKENLQLETFTVVSTGSGVFAWVSPWCKPAVYLYPETSMPVNVQVAPVGKMTVTIPKYPVGGWNVFAQPDGTLISDNKYFDYLYYEAEIPDEKIVKPSEGFVTAYDELDGTLARVLSQLGLQTNEADDFREYWIKVLPKAPYYKLSVVPQENLHALAPLTINPAPDTMLRVAVYFEALDEPIAVIEPSLSAVRRKGFTVVEWGGFFKRDPKRPFSCFM